LPSTSAGSPLIDRIASGAVRQPNPVTGKSILAIGGTAGNDAITISRVGAYLSVSIIEGNGSRFSYSRWIRLNGIDQIQIFGGAGNDTIVVRANVTLPTLSDGGTGNDSLTGAGGRNILIGGPGRDTLVGAGSSDILIGGSADVEANPIALAAVLDEWAGRGGYRTRVDAVSGRIPGVNGSALLNNRTVHHDDQANVLTGNLHSLDWFFVGRHDRLHGFHHGEFSTRV
jgi:Ca2+-binding RTX toxin-like protein